MAKAKVYEFNNDTIQQVWIFCPGCNTHHGFTTKDPQFQPWEWNGDIESPTFSPSMLVNASIPESRCHSFVRNGRIEYLSDCYHSLKGQTVDLPEIDDQI